MLQLLMFSIPDNQMIFNHGSLYNVSTKYTVTRKPFNMRDKKIKEIVIN